MNDIWPQASWNRWQNAATGDADAVVPGAVADVVALDCEALVVVDDAVVGDGAVVAVATFVSDPERKAAHVTAPAATTTAAAATTPAIFTARHESPASGPAADMLAPQVGQNPAPAGSGCPFGHRTSPLTTPGDCGEGGDGCGSPLGAPHVPQNRSPGSSTCPFTHLADPAPDSLCNFPLPPPQPTASPIPPDPVLRHKGPIARTHDRVLHLILWPDKPSHLRHSRCRRGVVGFVSTLLIRAGLPTPRDSGTRLSPTIRRTPTPSLWKPAAMASPPMDTAIAKGGEK